MAVGSMVTKLKLDTRPPRTRLHRVLAVEITTRPASRSALSWWSWPQSTSSAPDSTMRCWAWRQRASPMRREMPLHREVAQLERERAPRDAVRRERPRDHRPGDRQRGRQLRAEVAHVLAVQRVRRERDERPPPPLDVVVTRHHVPRRRARTRAPAGTRRAAPAATGPPR